MIIMLMWVFMSMVSMYMIVPVSSEKLFDKVDDDESRKKCIYCELSLFEWLWKYMHQWYRKHGSSSKRDEKIENSLVDLFKPIEDESSRWYECQDKKRKKHSYKL